MQKVVGFCRKIQFSIYLTVRKRWKGKMPSIVFCIRLRMKALVFMQTTQGCCLGYIGKSQMLISVSS